MRLFVTQSQIQIARTVSLGMYLQDAFPGAFMPQESSNRVQYNGTPVKAFHGTVDQFPESIGGNPIDFLMHYLGYDFPHAVKELETFAQRVPEAALADPPGSHAALFQLPERACPPFRNLFGFLNSRHIPFEMTKSLIRQNLLYQEAKTNRAVFANADGTCCECMKTISYVRFSTVLVMRKTSDAHWSVSVGNSIPEKVYLCENALEAISLMLLHQETDPGMPAAYWSMGDTVASTVAMPLLLAAVEKGREYGHVPVLAMRDSLQSKIYACDRKHFVSLCPKNQTWNEDLVEVSHGNRTD